jgi:hypothetical protein
VDHLQNTQTFHESDLLTCNPSFPNLAAPARRPTVPSGTPKRASMNEPNGAEPCAAGLQALSPRSRR